jgi:hypothetical protein
MAGITSAKEPAPHSRRRIHSAVAIAAFAAAALGLSAQAASASPTEHTTATQARTVEDCMFRALGNITMDLGTRVVQLGGGDEIWGDVDQWVDPTTYYNFYGYSLRFAASGHVNRAALQIEYCQE